MNPWKSIIDSLKITMPRVHWPLSWLLSATLINQGARDFPQLLASLRVRCELAWQPLAAEVQVQAVTASGLWRRRAPDDGLRCVFWALKADRHDETKQRHGP